jgi:CubicO group peptidase (beta-lactamase class C family)
VKTAFENNFLSHGEVGAAFAVVHRGQTVVDLWGGHAAPEVTDWQEDTVSVIFSGTKGLAALCVLMLIDRGQITLETPVCQVWPEFGARGKEGVLVRHLLTHTARLPGIRTPVSYKDMRDHRRMAALLAEQPQEPAPTISFCYHPVTFGWLCGELLRRVDGRSMGQFFREEVAQPLGLDLWIGLPPHLESRVAQLVLGPDNGADPTFHPEQRADDALFQSVWANPPLFTPEMPLNSPALHVAELPGVGGIGSARSIARLYAHLLHPGEDEPELLSQTTLDMATVPLAGGSDGLLTDRALSFGAGFALPTVDEELGPVPTAFGHGGAGGSRHGAWPDRSIGFSYVMNQLRSGEDPRGGALLTALEKATRHLTAPRHR